MKKYFLCSVVVPIILIVFFVLISKNLNNESSILTDNVTNKEVKNKKQQIEKKTKKLNGNKTKTNQKFRTKSPTKPEITSIDQPKEDLFFKDYQDKNGLISQVHIYAKMNITMSTGVMIYFHGDNANDFNNGQKSSRLNKLVRVAKKYNLLPIAIKTPANDLTWWSNGWQNSQYVNNFIKDNLFENYPINKKRILLVGYSGGSEFITENFIWRYGQNLFLGGGCILFAGGSQPEEYYNNYNLNFLKSFKMHYFSGTNDFMHDKVIKGVKYFIKKGFAVTYEYPEGEDHFDLPFSIVVEERLSQGFLE